MNTLPFIYVLNHPCVSLPFESVPAVPTTALCEDNGLYTAEVGHSLLSFCEMLASDAILQGLKEGSDRVAKSNYLSVKRSRRSRWQSPSRSSPSESPKQDDTNFPLSVVVEGVENSSIKDCCLTGQTCGNGSTLCVTNNDTEFVGLDVLALEKMSICARGSSDLNGALNLQPQCVKKVSEMVRSSTDYEIQSRRQGYDPRGIYDISEFPEAPSTSEPLMAVRSATIAGYISHISEGHRSVPPPEMMPFLEEPLLLVGPKLEWEGYVKARKISNEKRRKRRQQQMTPQELNKMTRMVIGYTLAFFLLVIVTFYIVYFV